MKHVQVKLYVDDIVIILSHPNSVIALKTLHRAVNILFKNCTKAGLVINVNKTRLTWYGTPHSLKYVTDSPLKINDALVKTVDKFTYLGVTIDSKLTMAPQADSMVQKANYLSYRFVKLRTGLSRSIATLLYKQTVLPKIDYCSFVTMVAPNTYTEKIQRIQNRMLRQCILSFKNWEYTIDEIHDLCETPED